MPRKPVVAPVRMATCRADFERLYLEGEDAHLRPNLLLEDARRTAPACCGATSARTLYPEPVRPAPPSPPARLVWAWE